MELNRKHNRNPSITQLIDHAQLHVNTKANLYKSRTSRKYNNLSAKFEALTGKFPISSILSHALRQQDRLYAQGWILGKDNEAVASVPFSSDMPCCPLESLSLLFS